MTGMRSSLRGISLTLEQNMTLETLASQVQPYTDKFLYVIDGVTLGWFNSLKEVPNSKRVLEPTALSDLGKEFYIRDLVKKELWCCFDERLRNRLLGVDLPEVRLPVVASFIPIGTQPMPVPHQDVSPVGTPVGAPLSSVVPVSKSPVSKSPSRALGRKPASTLKAPEASSPKLSKARVIDMTTSVEAAPSIVKQEHI